MPQRAAGLVPADWRAARRGGAKPPGQARRLAFLELPATDRDLSASPPAAHLLSWADAAALLPPAARMNRWAIELDMGERRGSQKDG